MKEIDFKINSDKSDIKIVEDILSEINHYSELEQEKVVNLQIALSEALLNAIVHGNKENREKFVYINIIYEKKYICIEVRDEGKGFDLNSLPNPTDDENLYKEHGRGIFIMKSLVDEFKCSASDKGTKYTLIVKQDK